MSKPWASKWAALAIACIAPMTLSGCLILPGEFTSAMTVRRTGDFTFSYKGQIQLLGLANLLNNELLNEGGESGEFKAVCWKDFESTDTEALDDESIKKTDKAAQDAKETEAALEVMRGDNKDSAATATAEEDADFLQDEETTDVSVDVDAAATDAAPSMDDSWEMEERECTAEEIAKQKEDWDEQQASKKKTEEEMKKMAAMLLGGIDPKDPETITRFTREVERLAAWHKVEHLGNGVFMIDYSTSGKLADDFAFPVIPRYAIGEPMIHITRWDNGRLRVEAPAFKTDPDLSIMAMLGAGSMMGMAGAGGKKPADPVAVKGTFTLTTDARIIANNTEEGPETVGGMEVLRWDVGPASYGAPMALLKLVM